MPAVRRSTPVAPPPTAGVNFGAPGFYQTGFGIRPGRYALEFHSVMHQREDAKTHQKFGDPVLSVRITGYPLDQAGNFLDVDPVEEYVSMGGAAHNVMIPTEDGKGFRPVPGATGSISDNTAWGFFLRSLWDSGLPIDGVLTDSFTAIDGIHAVTSRVAEPSDWADFRKKKKQEAAATGEAAMMGGAAAKDVQVKSRTIPTVTEILACPWEGQGGLPSETAAAPAPAKPGPKAVVARGKAAPPPPAAEESDDEAIKQAALAGITAVLEATPEPKKLALRTGTFKAVQKAHDDDMANAVIEMFFGDNNTLNALLSELGYTVKGMDVAPL